MELDLDPDLSPDPQTQTPLCGSTQRCIRLPQGSMMVCTKLFLDVFFVRVLCVAGLRPGPKQGCDFKLCLFVPPDAGIWCLENQCLAAEATRSPEDSRVGYMTQFGYDRDQPINFPPSPGCFSSLTNSQLYFCLWCLGICASTSTSPVCGGKHARTNYSYPHVDEWGSTPCFELTLRLQGV